MKTRWKIAQRFEIRWWKRYLGSRNSQDYLAWKKGYWTKLLDEKAAWPAPGEKILDAGCGPAGVFTVLHQHEVVALDPLMDEYTRAFGFLNKQGFPNVGFLSCPLEAFQPAARFDRIYCLNAINHVADMPRCLGNLHRALHDDGRLFLSVDAHNYPALMNLFRVFPGDILHPQQHDLASYARILAAGGWAIHKTFCLKKEFFFSHHWLELAKLPTAG